MPVPAVPGQKVVEPVSVTSRVVEASAGKGGQLTLGDLKEFIRTLDGAAAADSTPVTGRTDWRGRLQSLKASAVRFGDKQ